MVKVPFLDLRITNTTKKRELLKAIEKVFDHGRFIIGPEVKELEEKIAKFCNRKFAVGVGSGTDALFLGLKALGIKKGDEVITTSLSWIATANAIALTGATPVFADICSDLNIDPESIKRLITNKTKAIVPVHYTGKICKMNKIIDIARVNNLIVVEDAAQSFGSKLNGIISGSFGKIAAFSMNPMKVFAACGEAGMVLCDDENLYNRLIALRYNGTVNKETCIEASLNGRIDTLEASILLKRLKYVKTIIAKRKKIAAFYNKNLKGIVEIPIESEKEEDSYYSYTIQTPKRDVLKEYLLGQGIETKIQHPILMPHQPAYVENVRGEFSNAESIVKQILCLPAHENMNQKQAEYVVNTIKRFFKERT